MKKQYVAPQIEIERYDLSGAIAGCEFNWGPNITGAPQGSTCSNPPSDSGFYNPFDGKTYFYTTTVNICTYGLKDQNGYQNLFGNLISS